VGPFVKGDVVVLPFPFDDFTQAKRRPALVVATPAGLSPILAQITGRVPLDPFAVPLTPADFGSGAIQKASHIRTNILFTVNPSRILYRAGTVTAQKLQEVIDRIVYLFTT
jgi:mRNA interferase MazF